VNADRVGTPLLSVCIPTYCGAEHVQRLLASLAREYDGGFEVVACDDASPDDTFAALQRFAAGHAFVRIYRNARRLGMDGNFRAAARHGRGQYVWLFGQDDLPAEGAIRRVSEALRRHPEAGTAVLNFSQRDHGMEKVLCASHMDVRRLRGPALVGGPAEVVFSPADEYFSRFDALPTQLPAVLTRRRYWDETDLSAFEGTAFAQVALAMLNMRRSPVLLLTEPLVVCRVPDDRWQADGTALFGILTGAAAMLEKVRRDARDPMPASVHRLWRRRYLLNYFFMVRHCRRIGLTPGRSQVEALESVFGRSWLLRGYLLPVLSMPRPAMNAVFAALWPVKRVFLALLRAFGSNL
jgi:glycosyltransferase involved in cell wall biosynthesis